jgi:hypothetical protein
MLDCDTVYTKKLRKSIKQTKALTSGGSGSAASKAAKAANKAATTYLSTIPLAAGKEDIDLLVASNVALSDVQSAATAAENSYDAFDYLQAKAVKSQRKILNKILAD